MREREPERSFNHQGPDGLSLPLKQISRASKPITNKHSHRAQALVHSVTILPAYICIGLVPKMPAFKGGTMSQDHAALVTSIGPSCVLVAREEPAPFLVEKFFGNVSTNTHCEVSVDHNYYDPA